MNELDKAYEAVEMLRELDLPVSKEQLENIDRLEKKSGTRHRDDLTAYFYEQCFNHYIKRIMNIRQAKIRGEVIVAKPVLLLALIDSIDGDVFKENKFELNDWLEGKYVALMKKYIRNSLFSKVTGIENPFWHLSSDGFWFLQYKQYPLAGSSPSKRWLKENVGFAYFEEDVWTLLQNKVWRTKLRDYIIEHKLTNGNWLGRLGVIASLLLVA